MPSPFPGMDPYIEEPSFWPDFHGSLIYVFRADLNAVLPDRYVAHVDQYVLLHEPDLRTRQRLGRPDTFVTDQGSPSDGLTPVAALAALAAPAVSTLPVVRRTGSRYIQIRDGRERRIVTVIELLSPSNKDSGSDRDAYLAKRNEYLATGTNLVEIDLLRAGERLPLGEPAPTPADYYVFVSHAAAFPQVGIWPFTVRELLPAVRIPLGDDDLPVSVPLKTCFDRVYDEGRYCRTINYDEPPVPPLREPDAAWARDLLAARSEAKST
jgi:hypothetical protein